jgi:actin beta/gamma 1
MTSKVNRGNIIKLMFETFTDPSFYVSNPALLSLYSSYRTNRIVLESGYSLTQIVPIVDRKSISTATQRLSFGGRDLTNYFVKLLYERGQEFSTVAEKEIVRDIKEKLCYVANDYEKELQKASTSSEIDQKYKLPNGNDIKIGNESFRCPELLFKPDLDGFEFGGIDRILYDSITKCGSTLQNVLFANIVLSGGNTMFEGLAKRIEKEITEIAGLNKMIKVVIPEDRKHTALDWWFNACFTVNISWNGNY